MVEENRVYLLSGKPSPGVTGGTNATPKTICILRLYISLKKKGGSQLASGATGETFQLFMQLCNIF